MSIPKADYHNQKEVVSVNCKVRSRIPTKSGFNYYLYLYQSNINDKEHLALVYDSSTSNINPSNFQINSRTLIDRCLRLDKDQRTRLGLTENDLNLNVNKNKKLESVLTRVHSECFTGETIKSIRCDCGEQLEQAKKMIEEEGLGVIVYLRQEGRGIGLLEKLKAYNIQDMGYDTVQANQMLNLPIDSREYDVAGAILKDLGINTVKILTNNPKKVKELEQNGICVTETIPMVPLSWKLKPENTNHNNLIVSMNCNNNIGTSSNNNYQDKQNGYEQMTNIDQNDSHNDARNLFEEMNSYLRTKINKMGHLLDYPYNI